jgi:Leucine-rich repeat (LRR) protein
MNIDITLANSSEDRIIRDIYNGLYGSPYPSKSKSEMIREINSGDFLLNLYLTDYRGDSIPEDILRIERIRSLIMSDNRLVTTFHEIPEYTNSGIVYLDISRNLIEDSEVLLDLPDIFTNLEHLDVSHNDMFILKLPDVHTVEARNCSLVEISLNVWYDRLEYLDLADNMFVIEHPDNQDFASTDRYYLPEVFHPELSEDIFRNIPSLRELYLSGNQGIQMINLDAFSQGLVQLDLSDTDLMDITFNSDTTTLQELVLRNTSVDNSLINEIIAKYPNLDIIL